MNKVIIALIVVVLLGGIGFIILKKGTSTDYESPEVAEPVDRVEVTNPEADATPETKTDTVDLQEEAKFTAGTQTVIGTSVNGNDIVAYHYGSGDTKVLLVAGMHAGYSWNTVLLAQELMDEFAANPSMIPANVQVTVIPDVNPDGLEAVAGSPTITDASTIPASITDTVAGRFNANEVDLNRNFDCEWQASGTWQNQTVSGGSAPFSEPESIAMRNFVREYEPDAAIVYYSAAGGVYASNCNNGPLAETLQLTNLYANASGYPAFEEFDFYEITGDMVNWMAKNNIPAISVLLSDHKNIELSKNEAGVKAVLNSFAQ